MNKVEFLPQDPVSDRTPVVSHELRSPPKAAKLLLCVWGYSYVRQFLECGLPTLLAPGNVPAAGFPARRADGFRCSARANQQ